MKRITRLFLSALTVCALIVSALSGCRGAVCISELNITDAGGGGERICYIFSPAVNSEYIDQGDAQATWLTEYLISAVGEADAAAYTIKYEGTVSPEEAGIADSLYEMTEDERQQGYDVFSMKYSFADIKDYNRKTSRLYNLSKSLAADDKDDTYRVGILDDYVNTVLRVTELTDGSGLPTGRCSVTLTETGAVSYGAVAWAFIALYQNREDEAMWKTDDIYFAPFSDDETHTLFSALKTQLTVTVGETVRTVTPITGPVIEGQGEVEGIVFNVTGEMDSIEEDASLPLWLMLILCACGITVIAVTVAVIIRIKRNKAVTAE